MPAWLEQGNLVAEHRHRGSVRVPLLFSRVRWAQPWQEGRALLSVQVYDETISGARYGSGGGTEDGSPFGREGPSRAFNKVWLVAVYAPSERAARCMLSAIGGCGAVFSDLPVETLGAPIASGAFAEVHAAPAALMDNLSGGAFGSCAVKVPRFRPDYFRALRREVEMLSAAQGHAGIVSFFGLMPAASTAAAPASGPTSAVLPFEPRGEGIPKRVNRRVSGQ
mmetsp:Transcript_126992/g.405971  ORF Transcript_126992/g.405971 Transcript_126992/m.405971 type:complete len:223 (-) Transcript_126992:58-726(-)